MGTTIAPMPNGGPFEEDFPLFPAGSESGFSRLREAVKVKKPKVGKNLAKEAKGKKRKRGPFGESYSPVAAPAKGERVSESAPPEWSGTVKAMKKHKDIDNPFALAWSMKNKGDTPHHAPEKGKD